MFNMEMIRRQRDALDRSTHLLGKEDDLDALWKVVVAARHMVEIIDAEVLAHGSAPLYTISPEGVPTRRVDHAVQEEN